MAFAAPGSREDPPFELHAGHAAAIGAPLEAARLRLLAVVERLGSLLGEYAAPLLDAARRQLEERSCRIAVIGQIKAGKSTFINALARRPGLLPTDINPWTVVVTTLHFRRAPTPPEHAAVFQLFSREEWNDLAEGGGRLRELTERLVPGFDLDLLRAQLEVMRKRAESRLGPKFAELLGQCHRYETVTPELLADYVSAGAGETWPGKRRHYSDITRSADLYFNDSPFAFPITLIDTPGTNDPFLVRDEITRRSLENPDIYVFVVSALQPLSAADIAMLRLLNGLHKDRIVVFINRVDELPDPTGDAEVVKAAVEKRLRAEFPSLRIPVVYGSARLGNLRLQPEAERSAVAVPEGPEGPPERAKTAEPRGVSDVELETAPRPTDVLGVPAVHMNCGMADVATAITRLMCNSSIAMLLRQIAVCLAELVRTADVSDGAELRSIRQLLEARRQEAETVRQRLSEEEKSLAEFEDRVKSLLVSFAEVDAHFKEVVATTGSILRDQLNGLVREFASGEADALLASLSENGRPRQWLWRCDVTPLREQMEATYLAAFAQAARDLDRVEQFLYPQLRVIVSTLLPNYHGGLLEVPAWPEGLTPSVAPLSDKVTLDLGLPWWRRWFASRRLAKERANHLRCLIEEDFSKIAEELVQEAQTHLAERVDYVMRRVNAISNGLRAGVERRTANLARERALVDRAREEQDQERFEAEQQRHAEACAARQEAYTAVLGELEAVLGALDGAQDEGRPE